MTLRIKAKGLDRLYKKLSQDFSKVITSGFKRVADVIRLAAKAEAPQKTGKLAGGISKTPSGEFGWNIYESHKKGLWVREGTIGHSVYPRKKKAIYYEGLPHPVAWVAHPGIRHKNPYPERAVAKSEGEVEKTLDGIGAEIIAKIG